jgi:hypothetical protein
MWIAITVAVVTLAAVAAWASRRMFNYELDNGPIRLTEGGSPPPAAYLVRAFTAREAAETWGIPQINEKWFVSAVRVSRKDDEVWQVEMDYSRDTPE